MKSIGNDAFYKCESLASVQIPDSVESIGDGAFYNCKSLSRIQIPDSVKRIGNGAFDCCISLARIQIPDSVKSIGDYAFYTCTSLKEVIFKGKTIEDVKAMNHYPFGIKDKSIIKAEKQSKPIRKTAVRKPTKKQIKEAIVFWQNVLESLDNMNEVK